MATATPGTGAHVLTCQNTRASIKATNMTAVEEVGDEDTLDDYGLALSDGVVESVAHIGAQLAAALRADSQDLGAIGPFLRKWVTAEAELSALNLKEINEPSWCAADEARRAELERQFGAALKKLLGKAHVTGLRVDFPGEPRGPAIHVHMNPCLSNSFQGGLVVLL